MKTSSFFLPHLILYQYDFLKPKRRYYDNSFKTMLNLVVFVWTQTECLLLCSTGLKQHVGEKMFHTFKMKRDEFFKMPVSDIWCLSLIMLT